MLGGDPKELRTGRGPRVVERGRLPPRVDESTHLTAARRCERILTIAQEGAVLVSGASSVPNGPERCGAARRGALAGLVNVTPLVVDQLTMLCAARMLDQQHVPAAGSLQDAGHHHRKE